MACRRENRAASRHSLPLPAYGRSVLRSLGMHRLAWKFHTPVPRETSRLARTVHPKVQRAPIRRCGTRLGRELRLGVGRRLDAREGALRQLECEICGLGSCCPAMADPGPGPWTQKADLPGPTSTLG